jgi:propanediol dehydratase small subunit
VCLFYDKIERVYKEEISYANSKEELTEMQKEIENMYQMGFITETLYNKLNERIEDKIQCFI